MYGVTTDANGLYYMRARYYNVAIKRFINQDVVDGSITNSQSLNKFSYVQGNPIRLTDPFGLCPDISLTRIGHAALDLLGIIPGFDGCDGINAVWYLIEGDYANAATSAVAAFPLIGSLIGSGIKWGAKGVANAEKIADGIKTGSRIIGNAGALIQSGGQALESAGNLYDSYVKDGEVISWKNATDLITLGLSVAGMGMAGKSLAKDGKALKAVSKGNVNVKPAAVSNSTAASNSMAGGTGRFKMDLQMFASSNGSSNPFYKQGGGSNLDDFMTPHAQKHAYNPNVKSTKNKTQFGENIDVAKLREDTMLHPDKVIYDSEYNMIKYVKEYDFNISTLDTPTGSHRVFINLAPKAGKTNRNSQFPYYGGDK